MRDDVTEGYNIIPNFFISAKIDEHFDYTNDGIEKTDRRKNKHKQLQFKNRLFDRDTLLLFHYDVNFLFILSMYARDKDSEKAAWKDKIRDRFRREIQEWLQYDYDFYTMTAHPDVNGEEYIHDNFKQLVGKVYTPFKEENIYSFALDNDEAYQVENTTLLKTLEKYFFVVPCKLGENPELILEKRMATGYEPVEKQFKTGVLMVMMENFSSKSKHFIPNGKIAVGFKFTKDGIEIAEHIKDIGYITSVS